MLMDWPTLEPAPCLDIRSEQDVRTRPFGILLESVLEEYKQGDTPEQIAENYAPLDQETVEAVVAYYLEHQEAVDQYLACVKERLRQRYEEHLKKPDSPVIARLKALSSIPAKSA